MIINPEIITEKQIQDFCNSRYTNDWAFWHNEITRDIKEYDRLLPPFLYQRFSDIIQKKTRETTPPIKVLDLGSGACVAPSNDTKTIP